MRPTELSTIRPRGEVDVQNMRVTRKGELRVRRPRTLREWRWWLRRRLR